MSTPCKQTDRLIRDALKEDIAGGDVTSKWIFGPRESGRAVLFVKENAVVAGLDIACRVWEIIDSGIELTKLNREGSRVGKGAAILRVSGTMRSLMAGERTALNFLQRLSGIATLTSEFVRRVEGKPVKILDTRKTTPGWRILEKYAVRVGGGVNHRFGLYDMVLLKENHLRGAESTHEALRRVARKNKAGLPVEIEVRNIEGVEEVIELIDMIDRIMFDNMSIPEMKKCVKLVRTRIRGRKKPLLEASGNVTLQNVRKIADTGVDYISAGALTHSAGVIDMSFLIE